MSFSTISVIGLGYIGLPTAAAFASGKNRWSALMLINMPWRPLTVERFISSSRSGERVKTAVEQAVFKRHHHPGGGGCLT